MNEERRRFFRVRYPSTERPVLEIGGIPFDVSELSEGGLRAGGSAAHLTEASDVHGTLRLLSGKSFEITAAFARIDGSELVFEDLEGVSFAEMMHEQRYLIRKYPTVRQNDDAERTAGDGTAGAGTGDS